MYGLLHEDYRHRNGPFSVLKHQLYRPDGSDDVNAYKLKASEEAYEEAPKQKQAEEPKSEGRVTAKVKKPADELSAEKTFFKIVIPAYNCAKTIKKCLDSVLMQKFRDFTISIVDDVSTDETSAVCQEYADKWNGRITFEKLEEKRWPGGCRNAGVENGRPA